MPSSTFGEIYELARAIVSAGGDTAEVCEVLDRLERGEVSIVEATDAIKVGQRSLLADP